MAIPLVPAQDGVAPRPEIAASPRVAASGGTDAAASSREQNGRTEPPRLRDAAANPLTPFLERWLSPRDRAGRKIATPALMAPRTADRTAAPLGSEPPQPAPPVALSGGGKPTPANPYLEAMDATAPVAPTENAASRDAAPAAPPPSLAPSPAADEARVVAPTLTAPEAPERRPDPAYRPPPSRDAKYFPQQKRF